MLPSGAAKFIHLVRNPFLGCLRCVSFVSSPATVLIKSKVVSRDHSFDDFLRRVVKNGTLARGSWVDHVLSYTWLGFPVPKCRNEIKTWWKQWTSNNNNVRRTMMLLVSYQENVGRLASSRWGCSKFSWTRQYYYTQQQQREELLATFEFHQHMTQNLDRFSTPKRVEGKGNFQFLFARASRGIPWRWYVSDRQRQDFMDLVWEKRNISHVMAGAKASMARNASAGTRDKLESLFQTTNLWYDFQ